MPKKVNELIKKNFNIELKGVDKDNKTLDAIFSTQGEDRHGDIVIQDGWDLAQFKKNPVILNSHNHSDATEVIGKVEKGSLKIENKKLTGKIKFAVDENPKAKIIYDLYAGGFLNAFSVGFIAREYDPKDFSKIIKAELLEVSAVSVPANAYALAKQKGIEVDKLYDKSNNENDTEDKENEETITEDDSNNSEAEREEDKSTETEQDGGISEDTEEIEETVVEEGDKEEGENEIKQLRKEINEIKELIAEKKEEKKEVKPEVIIAKKNKEERLQEIIKSYKENKISSLAKITQAVKLVSESYKGQSSNNKTDNNYLVNQAIKELIKLKD